mmetsp:Transcript_89576/g.252470  ORF Transcript_89576/g.252470 Transcript_89576/m.252470 type:complete len:228 (+) Transcript_89576:546-1229(+)
MAKSHCPLSAWFRARKVIVAPPFMTSLSWRLSSHSTTLSQSQRASDAMPPPTPPLPAGPWEYQSRSSMRTTVHLCQDGPTAAPFPVSAAFPGESELATSARYLSNEPVRSAPLMSATGTKSNSAVPASSAEVCDFWPTATCCRADPAPANAAAPVVMAVAASVPACRDPLEVEQPLAATAGRSKCTSRKRNLKAWEPPFVWICSGRSSRINLRSRNAWLPGAMMRSS